MNPIGFAVHKPVTVLVGVIVLVLFGVLALVRLPVQLTPDVDQPLVTVSTRWEGASPQEVEQEIVNEQEEMLKSLQGLERMTSTAVEGTATVQLEFRVGTETSRALLDVSEKLRQVPSYPDNVDEPVISAGETEGANAIAWMVLRREDDSLYDAEDLPFLKTLIDQKVKPVLERAAGVASVGVVGGVEQEVHVRVDPHKLAARELTLMDVRNAVRARNVDISAGTLDRGKTASSVRTVGKFDDLEDLNRLVLARRDGQPVTLADVGSAVFGYKKQNMVVRSFGAPTIAVNAQKESGTNIIEVMAALEDALVEANGELLAPRGLRLEKVYDQTDYIFHAIDLVLQNLWIGGLLAAAVLFVFLRSVSSTLVVALAIPISVIGSFLALTLLGRNLNVVSLAGLAFAVGMVVDNSIVVLENIYRHRQLGKSARAAALDGCKEVWGAVLASTLTTLAVFVPVVFVEQEAGQLFRDIALAISAAVLLSLFISVLFIPMAAARTGSRSKPRISGKPRGGLERFGVAFRDRVAGLVGWLNRRVWRQVATVVGLTGAALLVSWMFLPPMSYLPQGNQNLVIGFLIPPPGYNADELVSMGKTVERTLAPYWQVDSSDQLSPELKFPPWYRGEDPIPAITNFFFVARGKSVFMGGRSADDNNVTPLKDLFQRAASQVPGVLAFAMQSSLFERGLSESNTIDLEVTGNDFGEIQSSALGLMGRLMAEFGPPRPEPSNFHLGGPEIRIVPDDARTSELDLMVEDLGFMVRSMVDGAIVSDYRHEGETLDVKLVPVPKGEQYRGPLEETPLFTPSGTQVPLASVARLIETTAPNEIRHMEERRAVKLSIPPPPGIELSLAMDRLENEVVPELRAAGAIADDVSLVYSGTADKLRTTRTALQWNFVLAVILTYLLLSALFESFLFPLVILLSVPLAAVGGILGLRAVHEITGHSMDVLTMLGFVILVGTVVNNAILIVHQGLRFMREEEFEPGAAVIEAVRTRVRPIFMSTATSVLGMLPLVLFPGAGSELYRGLGSVVVGGLIASTLFTLLVVPTFFRLVLSASRSLRSIRGRVRQAA